MTGLEKSAFPSSGPTKAKMTRRAKIQGGRRSREMDSRIIKPYERKSMNRFLQHGTRADSLIKRRRQKHRNDMTGGLRDGRNMNGSHTQQVEL